MWALLHAADIAAQAKPRPLFIKWCDRCYEEFFRQGDREKALGRPASALMDRTTTRIPQSQVGFIKFIVLPMFEALAIVKPDMDKIPIASLQRNLAYWEDLASIALPEVPESPTE